MFGYVFLIRPTSIASTHADILANSLRYRRSPDSDDFKWNGAGYSMRYKMAAHNMPEPITTIAILKQLKDALPLMKAGWAKVTESEERDAGLRLILFMEGKRIFDPDSFEIPYGCYKSVENIMSEAEKERGRLPNDAFNRLLFDFIKVCNSFKTILDKMNLSENKQWDGQLQKTELIEFRDALVQFRYQVGVQIAVIGEVWHVEVPVKLIPRDLMRSLFPGLKTRD
jgi:hypothetical protein